MCKSRRIGLGIMMYLGLEGLYGPSSLAFQITGYVGRNLSPETPNTSLTLEPDLRIPTSAVTEIEANSLIDRPFDPYQNFAVPRTDLIFKHFLIREDATTLSVRYGLSFPELDRWSAEGHQIKPSVAVQSTIPVSSHLKLLGRLGSYYKFTKYTQRPNGDDYAKFGFFERVSAIYQAGIFAAELTVNIEQGNTGIWKNDYGTEEQLSVEIQKDLSVGVMHELLAESVDSTTGFYRPVRVFDSRDSRLSVFMTLKM